MYKILLCCFFGASTSMLEERMNNVIKKNNYHISITTRSFKEVESILDKEDYNMVLLGPQVSYRKRKLEDKYSSRGIVIKDIAPDDYGMMNAEKIIKEIVSVMHE